MTRTHTGHIKFVDMQVDKQALTKLLEAFVDVVELFHRESMLYQMLFTADCKAKGLNEDEIHEAVEAGRNVSAEKIREASEPSYKDLLAKIPQIVDLLDSNPDEAFRLLKDW